MLGIKVKLIAIVAIVVMSTGLASSAPTTQLISVSPIGAFAPESIAFNPNGEGPYVGVADGRILKWQGGEYGRGVWVQFATTAPRRWFCRLPDNPRVEQFCGRPLGLRFDSAGNLYIADAYFGLQVVGPNGGLATTLVRQAEGVPFRFTNDLDIDDENGFIYFTDSSTVYQRNNFGGIISSNDMTGRLIRYNTRTREVTVLLRGLVFANGVTLSKDRSFVLVAESTRNRITRFWLKGPYAGRRDTFASLLGSPDNIRRNLEGDFWVAELVGNEPRAVKLNQQGKVVQVIRGLQMFRSISQVYERAGKLWLGSVSMPFMGVHNLY